MRIVKNIQAYQTNLLVERICNGVLNYTYWCIQERIVHLVRLVKVLLWLVVGVSYIQKNDINNSKRAYLYGYARFL